MLNLADFDETFSAKPDNIEKNPCQPPACFVGSYAPVTPAGEQGPFFVNSYLLQSNRKMEVAGPVKVRSADLEKCRK